MKSCGKGSLLPQFFHGSLQGQEVFLQQRIKNLTVICIVIYLKKKGKRQGVDIEK